MATTKATLEALVIAQRAQMERMQAQLDQLATAAPKKERKADKPLVSRGYFKTRDEATDKWLDDTSRPCVIVAVPGAKPEKMKVETFESKYITLHAQIVAAYKALA